MTRGQREKLNEIMGYLWAKSDDALCAGYAEDLGNMLAEDEKLGALGNPPYVYVQDIRTDPYTFEAESKGKDEVEEDGRRSI